jgi:hypothetical protein
MRWAGHVARMREMLNIYIVLWESQKERYNKKEEDVAGRIILKFILEK